MYRQNRLQDTGFATEVQLQTPVFTRCYLMLSTKEIPYRRVYQSEYNRAAASKNGNLSY